MQRRLLAMTVVALAFSTAQAADKGGSSEFFHQAGTGASEVTGTLGYDLGSTTAKGATVANKQTGLDPLMATYEYGLNDMLALGGYIGYVSYQNDSGATPIPKTSGLTDPNIYIKAVTGMWHYGADLNLAYSKSKIDATGNYTTGGTGGISLTPYVGLDMAAGPGTFGAKLAYMYNMDRSIDSNGTDVKLKGTNATTLTAFYEWMMADCLGGADLAYTSFDETKKSTGGAADVSAVKAFSVVGLDLYARIPVSGFEILPKLTYGLSTSGDVLDKYNPLNLSVAGRWTF